MKIRGYYFITDAKLSRAGNINDVKSALSAGVNVVQYRNKEGSTKELYEEAVKLKRQCKNKALFLINDRIDIALAVDADGVHMGTEDMPYAIVRKMLGRKKIIGMTAHNIEEGREARRLGADYIGISPVFATDTKKAAGTPVGIGLIKKIKKAVKLPVIAIGGITLNNAKEVIEAGADGLCAISAVVTKKDVKREIKKFQKLFP